MIPKVYSSEEFEEKYTYSGELGFEWSPEKTDFRLWAPTAEKAKIRLFKSGNPDAEDCFDEIEMVSDVSGTWIAEKEGDLNGVYYTFSVTVEGKEREAADPYARAAGTNGKRSMVINLSETNPEDWEEDKGVFYGKSITDAILYELHIRDLSSDESSGIVNKGKFLGAAEEGTKTPEGIPTGLDHIKELGVTHVHFLPSFDYGSVDESALDKPQFNWGYDPENFNIPEGSYSTDPEKGAVRIREMKQMIRTFHKNGIGVVMDVVYNHVFHTEEFCLNVLVPGYFSRTDENGNYSAGSGCGNDTASERSMVKKYIVDSVKYWADEYHIDGFRFDLSGLLDIATMNEITEAVHPTHPNVIFYCEGWVMPTHVTKPVVELANQYNSEKMPGCSFFSDTIRDYLIGPAFKAEEKGFVTGKPGRKELFEECFKGMPFWCKNPTKCINYVSCHDGYTLFDRIGIACPEADFMEKIRRSNLAAAVYMLSEGVPFFQAGEEMLRTKTNPDGTPEHNSYKSPDSVNGIKWSNLSKPEYKKVFEYYKGLIRFRKAHGALRLESAGEVYSHVSVAETGAEDVFAFHIWGGAKDETAEAIFVAFNPTEEEKEIRLPVGKWKLCINGETAGTKTLSEEEGTYKIGPLCAAAMIK